MVPPARRRFTNHQLTWPSRRFAKLPFSDVTWVPDQRLSYCQASHPDHLSRHLINNISDDIRVPSLNQPESDGDADAAEMKQVFSALNALSGSIRVRRICFVSLVGLP